MDASEDAFVRLYRDQYRPLVAFFVRRIDDVELARDLTAETFRIAWSRQTDGPFDRAWLYGVARNLVGDEYRRRTRERAWLAAAPADTQHQRTAHEDALEVQDVLGRLPPAYREALILTYWEGLDASEVGRLLGVSRSAVWMRLFRARRAFAAEWETAAGEGTPILDREEGPA